FVLGNPGPNGRLAKALGLVEGKPLALSASSVFESWRRRGMFQAQATTPTGETGVALSRMLEELKRMHDDGPTPAELAQAKTQIAGRYPTNFDSVGEVASAMLVSELQALGDDWVKNYGVNVDAVTFEQAKAAAQKLDP